MRCTFWIASGSITGSKLISIPSSLHLAFGRFKAPKDRSAAHTNTSSLTRSPFSSTVADARLFVWRDDAPVLTRVLRFYSGHVKLIRPRRESRHRSLRHRGFRLGATSQRCGKISLTVERKLRAERGGVLNTVVVEK